MYIKRAVIDDAQMIAPLISKYRVELRSLKNIKSCENTDSARQEFCEYINSDYPVYLAIVKEKCVGFIVCRIDAPCVWAEALYVLESERRQGIALRLFECAEEEAKSYGEDTVYNYVHPNNDKIIRFLSKKGYTVLNLLEVRKKYPDEDCTTKIKISNNEFDY